ncbi:transposase, partial [Fundicoccus sp. Sow4_H7]|uniref:transposase n=1 Tax=Fundicoccus sp. Sow4_H7 TaxID=3438784 RepID=UPI003F912B84
FVSTHTVRRVIKQTASAIRVRPTHDLPEHLSFDEFKSVRSVDAAMSFIMSDAVTHQVVDVVEDRKKRSLSAYFCRYPLKVRRKVKTITIDMYEPYMDIIQRWFPKAKIMIDSFHIIQAISRELNKYRTQFMNSVRTKDERLYNKFKRYWKLILMKPEKLQSFTYHPFKLFDWLTNTQGIV